MRSNHEFDLEKQFFIDNFVAVELPPCGRPGSKKGDNREYGERINLKMLFLE